jgi:guanylate kinase
LVRELVARDPSLWLSRSWTTRAPRPGEDPDAYTYVDHETFLKHAKAGGFLEWATILGEYYGTPLPEPPEGHDVVLEIDVQGAEQVRDRYDGVVTVLLVPPSEDEQRRRLAARGDAPEQIERRVALGSAEIERGRPFAEAIVVNDDLERAVQELEAIVAHARQR